MWPMKKLSFILLVLMLTCIVTELVVSQHADAAAGLGKETVGGKKVEGVITSEKPSKLKIWFGVGMLVAGVLAVKYL